LYRFVGDTLLCGLSDIHTERIVEKKLSLTNKKWTRVSLHKVVLEWLRAEQNTNPNLIQQFSATPSLRSLLEDNADLNAPDDNRVRLQLIYLARWIFLLEIPPDTRWYEVRNLTDEAVGELRAVNYHEWTDPGDKNELQFTPVAGKVWPAPK
jgi:hypothetical protein